MILILLSEVSVVQDEERIQKDSAQVRSQESKSTVFSRMSFSRGGGMPVNPYTDLIAFCFIPYFLLHMLIYLFSQ